MKSRWIRVVGSGVVLAAFCLLPGCQTSGSGSSSKINWPWRSKTTPTVPPAPSGAARSGSGGDPFLPPVAEPRTEPPAAAPAATAPPKTGTSNYRASPRTAALSVPADRPIELVAAGAFSREVELARFTSDLDAIVRPMAPARGYRYIVLHQTGTAAGNLKEIDQRHREQLGRDGCGFHFIVGNGAGAKDGEIETANRWIFQKNGGHLPRMAASDFNLHGIGICLVGDFSSGRPTINQIAATRALVAYLMNSCDIPSSRIVADGELSTADANDAAPANQTHYRLRLDDVLPRGAGEFGAN